MRRRGRMGVTGVCRCGSEEPDCTITTRSTGAGRLSGAPAGERLHPEEEEAEERSAHVRQMGDSVVGPEPGCDHIERHEPQDQRAGLDGDREGEDDQLRVGPEVGKRHRHAEHRAGGPDEGADRHDAGQQQGKHRGADATIQVVEDEVPAAHPALDRGAEHVQHQHVGEEMQQARVHEHVGDEASTDG